MEITLHRLFVSRHSHFVVAKVNKVCYYVLARNRIALTQDFLSWVWDFVYFFNHDLIIQLEKLEVNRKC